MSSTGDKVKLELDDRTREQLDKIADLLSGVDMCPEECLAWLTNMLVELAYGYGMPLETLSWAIQLKYALIEKRYAGAGPRDAVH